jgi:hypothetical protein
MYKSLYFFYKFHCLIPLLAHYNYNTIYIRIYTTLSKSIHIILYDNLNSILGYVKYIKRNSKCAKFNINYSR